MEEHLVLALQHFAAHVLYCIDIGEDYRSMIHEISNPNYNP